MSGDGKFILDLEPREDNEHRTYFVAKIKAPITIDCHDGVAFLCFISKEGEEELHICSMKKPNHRENMGKKPNYKVEE